MDDNTAGHNLANRRKLIRDFIRSLVEIDAAMQPYKDQRKDIMKRVKDDLNMNAAQFKVAVKLAQMEQVERDEVADTIREVFEALGMGQQSNFIPVLETVAPPPPASAPMDDDQWQDGDVERDEAEEPDEVGDEDGQDTRTSDIDPTTPVVPL